MIERNLIRVGIAGLESGRYTQHRGDLGGGTHLCILGALNHAMGGDEALCNPSDLSAEPLAGIGDRDGNRITLVSLNDKWGVTFPQFVDILRWAYGLPRGRQDRSHPVSATPRLAGETGIKVIEPELEEALV